MPLTPTSPEAEPLTLGQLSQGQNKVCDPESFIAVLLPPVSPTSHWFCRASRLSGETTVLLMINSILQEEPIPEYCFKEAGSAPSCSCPWHDL